MIQGYLLVGGRIYSRPVERCGMDVFRSFCDRERAEAGKSAKRSPARTRRHLLDCAQRLAVARPAGRIREMELGLSPVHPMEPGGTADILFEASAETEAIFRCASNDSIRPLCGRTPTQMAERGDLEKHSWPFVRWLLDQNSPPHKRRRPANWHHDHGG